MFTRQHGAASQLMDSPALPQGTKAIHVKCQLPLHSNRTRGGNALLLASKRLSQQARQWLGWYPVEPVAVFANVGAVRPLLIGTAAAAAAVAKQLRGQLHFVDTRLSLRRLGSLVLAVTGA